MTVPRQIIPGSIYLVTRRCSERRFFLAPNREVNELFGYLLATQVEMHGLELLAAVQMSNHYHIVVHDVHGNLPNFMRDFHALVARSVNRVRRRVDAFWDARQPAVTELADAEAVMEMLVYLACNPVKAGLVGDGRDWPGLRTATHSVTQRPRAFRRPVGFFRAESALPPTTELKVSLPPTHKHLTQQQFAAELTVRVRHRESEIAAHFAAEGRRFGRARDLVRLRWQDAPATEDRRFEPRPNVAATEPRRRRGLLARIRGFLAAYRRALADYRRGFRGTVFPAGSWGVARLHMLDVDPPPRPAWQT